MRLPVPGSAGIANKTCAVRLHRILSSAAWRKGVTLSQMERIDMRAICETLYVMEHAVASPHVSREVERGCAKKRTTITFGIDNAPLHH
jgi:hypothetical protein